MKNHTNKTTENRPVAVANNENGSHHRLPFNLCPPQNQALVAADHRLATVEATPVAEIANLGLPAPLTPGSLRRRSRNGKIARLPKIDRDMVNRMLFNNIPYPQIAKALREIGIYATARNISNWKTRGGYKEWCGEQERQLQLSLIQDNLIDYVRKNDAGQLAEVGLQVAATQLSSSFLHPDVSRQLAADPKTYSQAVDMLCRLSTHLQALQKDRNKAVDRAALKGTGEHFQHEQENIVDGVRSIFSGTHVNDKPVPHRNDVRVRDELPYREPPPVTLTREQKMAIFRLNGIDPLNPPWRQTQNPKPAETKKEDEANAGAKEAPSTPL